MRRVPTLRYLMLYRGYLRESGWHASARMGAPVDADGHPVPWYTYAALAFLEPRLGAEMEVFEYGAGHSTLWWAARVSHVCSVESDMAWIERLRPRLPDNVDVRHEARSAPYAASAKQRGRRFDVIVIDGLARNECARDCLEVLKDDGVIVWDNAERERDYRDGLRHLEANGLRRIDFDGLGPLNGYAWRTTIFYRPMANCLGL